MNGEGFRGILSSVMKKEKIVLFGDPVLRQVAQPVAVFHKKLHSLVEKLRLTLLHNGDGAALAANQIGLLKRITVIEYMEEYFEMINPEIVDSSGESVDYEGCLSFPGYSGRVIRAERVTVRFQDRHGKEICLERSGRMARCIQHELDHLNGILYVDRLAEPFVTHDEKETRLPADGVIRMSRGG